MLRRSFLALLAACPACRFDCGMRSLLYNGHFLLDQIKEGGVYAVGPNLSLALQGPDAWSFNAAGEGAFSIQVVNAPNNLGKAMKIACTAVDQSIADNVTYDLYTGVAGRDVLMLKMGTAAALSVTFSFDFQTTLPGIYYLSVCNNFANESYIAPITAPDTQDHHYIVTIPMDTGGQWEYGPWIGFSFCMSLGAGSAYRAAKNTWHNGNYNHDSGQVNFMSSISNVAYLRNVRCSIGSQETPVDPDDLNPGIVLANYQGFYEKSYSQGTPVGTATRAGAIATQYQSGLAGAPGFRFKTPRRHLPTYMTGYSSVSGAQGKWWDTSAADQTVSFNNVGAEGVEGVMLTSGTAMYLGHYVANNRLT